MTDTAPGVHLFSSSEGTPISSNRRADNFLNIAPRVRRRMLIKNSEIAR